MQYIEPREVIIRTSNFEMEGIISGTRDAFNYESSNSHFIYWFPSGIIDSLAVKKNQMKPEQQEIIEACENKMKEFLPE
ncbi:hypothetical protein A3860_02545 [Niastella vici]|uniref:Uncharacterized protein n=1 Tax=Niastella vici TaxID=1703345 RepID=A0A1V9G9C6_9BACT|nr:hypothetical protein [Niastella vici]OQP67259.1 hypothetical protein A3860_02545 [Niastella vici]